MPAYITMNTRIYVVGHRRLVSSCTYPRKMLQPMSEESLLTGPPEPTSEPYAIAKIAGDATKGQEAPGWEPRTSFTEQVVIMVEKNLERLWLETVPNTVS